MRFFLIIISLSSILFSSESISFGNKEKSLQETRVYTIQLFSTKDLKYAENLFKKVPLELQKKAHLYEVDNWIKCRYAQTPFYSKIKPFVKKLKKAGFKDVFIVETTLLKMKNKLLQNPNSKLAHSNSSRKKPTKIKSPKNSRFLNSNLLLKANRAYKNGDEFQAMLYYEMLIANGDDNQKVKNNLCYLYGKRGAWLQAKDIIDKQRYINRLLYAYAYGAVETNQEDFYNNLSQYIMIDKSGRLSLLSGYYFEKQDRMQRALGFYKMAYEKNPSDLYNLFAYARAEDIAQNYKKATLLYKNILKRVDSSNPLYSSAKERVTQLGE